MLTGGGNYLLFFFTPPESRAFGALGPSGCFVWKRLTAFYLDTVAAVPSHLERHRSPGVFEYVEGVTGERVNMLNLAPIKVHFRSKTQKSPDKRYCSTVFLDRCTFAERRQKSSKVCLQVTVANPAFEYLTLPSAPCSAV